MAFIPVPDTAKVAVNCTQDGQDLVSVFHFSKPGGYTTAAELTTLADNVAAAWGDHMVDIWADGVQGRSVTAVDLSVEGGAGVEVSFTDLASNDFPGMPTNVTIAVKWITGLTGRSNRGRTYHIGLRAAHIDGNQLTTIAAGEIEATWNAIFDQLTLGGDPMVVASLYHDNAPRVTGVTTPIVGAVLADINLDSQRRRLTGRGS
jgi:hypothetical protein